MQALSNSSSQTHLMGTGNEDMIALYKMINAT